MNKHSPPTHPLVKTVAVIILLPLFFGLLAGPVSVAGQVYAAPPLDDGTPTPTGGQPAGYAGGVFTCAGWKVTVPAGIVPDGGLVHCGSFNPDNAPLAPTGYNLLRRTISINIYDNNGQWITFFTQPLTFCYAYSDADIAAAGGDVTNLTIVSAPIGGSYSLHLTTGNPTTKQVCASVDHLTLFDLAAPASSGSAVSAATSAPSSAATPAPDTGGPYVYIYTGPTTSYTVKQGDNLFRISLRFNTTVAAIQAANGLVSTKIYVGQVLRIPATGAAAATATKTATAAKTATPSKSGTATPTAGPRTHVVQTGENLYRIALKYGTTVAAIQAANGLTSTTIYVGQTLIIPGK